MLRKFNVLSGEFAHETNTFCTIPTTIENFHRQTYIVGNDNIVTARKDTRSAIGATIESAEKYGWNLIMNLSATANPSGKLTDDTFETLTDIMLRPLNSESVDESNSNSSLTNSKIDGIILHLHGAMVSDSYQDSEGEILHRIRSRVGPSIPIVVTLDLHGNITEKMAQNCSSLIAVRTYPHIDFYERALQAAELLQSIMLGEVSPVTVIAKRPMLRGLDGGRTQKGPMIELITRGEALEQSKENEILVVSICAGFTAADIYDIGPSVTVTVNIKPATGTDTPPQDETVLINNAKQIADEFMDYAWETREYSSVKHLTIPEAIEKFDDFNKTKRHGPLVAAEVTDNPGSGHYGDATNLLKAMVDMNLHNAVFYAIYDPAAVVEGINIGCGNNGIISIGGKHDPNIGGGPLALDGTVVSITNGSFPAYGPMGGGVWFNMGLSIMFRVGGLDIIIISNNGQALDLAHVTSLGCDPVNKSIVVLKSAHHFRAAFGPIASEIVTVDGGGLGSMILKCGNYKNVRRPIWPLDDIH
jgi:microcystin degradation protein MlrC